MNIDDARNTLSAAGWSIGDALVNTPEGPLWQVYLHRGEQKIVAKASSHADAWCEALRLAESVRRLINTIDLARMVRVSKGAIKQASRAGVFPMIGYDRAHVALFDRDDPRLLAWLAAIKGDGRLNDARV